MAKYKPAKTGELARVNNENVSYNNFMYYKNLEFQHEIAKSDQKCKFVFNSFHFNCKVFKLLYMLNFDENHFF